MKIIYLHGFASSGNSSKSDWLREQFSSDSCSVQGIEFISPDLPNKSRDAALFLDDFLANLADESVCLIGTSLGGFFAAFYGAKHGWPAVLINPLADVQDLIGSAMGENSNYATGETFIMDESDGVQLIRMNDEMKTPVKSTLLLIDKADDVLDYHKAVLRYGEHATTHLFEGGSHRFDHLPKSMPEIMALIAHKNDHQG